MIRWIGPSGVLVLVGALGLGAFPGSGEAMAAARTKLKVFVCPSDTYSVLTESGPVTARFRMNVRVRSARFGSSHSGGANFAFADGSVHFLRSSGFIPVFDADGSLVGIRGEMVEEGRTTWTVFILPYIEQNNLYQLRFRSDSGKSMSLIAKGRLV